MTTLLAGSSKRIAHTMTLRTGFGEIWPPSVVAVLDFFETLWTLNLESLNSECAVGRVLFPSSCMPHAGLNPGRAETPRRSATHTLEPRLGQTGGGA